MVFNTPKPGRGESLFARSHGIEKTQNNHNKNAK